MALGWGSDVLDPSKISTEQLKERIRAIVESPEGWIYLSTDTGKILRIKPAE